MANEDSLNGPQAGSAPKFYFQVQWDSAVLHFEEVSGLDIQAETIKYRNGDSPVFSDIKMPGLKKYGNVTMKRGVFQSGNRFSDWFDQIKMNTVKRVPVTIRLLDEEGNATMVWTLTNAWPTKVTGANLKSGGNEVAVDSIEIAHEGLTIANG